MRSRTRTSLAILIALAPLALATGCSNKLETGYEPVRLNASPQQRRAYYAPPFSPEARTVADREDELRARRPRTDY